MAVGAESRWPATEVSATNEFVFTRLMYRGTGQAGWPRWQADWPEAETHFSAGLSRLTRIDVSADGQLVDFASDLLFDYPWLYAVEVGALELNDSEAATLRDYLLRGGFLMVDDFHGPAQWESFARALQRLFPDRPVVELDGDHEIFHVLYDIDEREQIPGIRALMMNRTWEFGGQVPHWRGVLDDQGRVMIAIHFNMDLGDAWEHADDPRYPQPYTTMAYRLGVNAVLYAMTH